MGRRQGGFTLIEVLVAVVLVSVGVLALVGALGMVTRMIGQGKTATVAAQVAAQRLEQLRVAAASTTPLCTASDFAGSAAPVTSQGMTEQWTVAPVAAFGATQLRSATVTVSYRAPGGIRSATMSTLISCTY